MNHDQLKQQQFFQKLASLLWFGLVIGSALQVFIFPARMNLIAVSITLVAWLIFTRFIFRYDLLSLYPLSGFLILGYALTHFYCPLLFTLFEGKPLIFNLDTPQEVFVHSLLVLILLVLGHGFYRYFFSGLSTRITSALQKLRFFEAPTEVQLLLMGVLGLSATYYIYFYSPSIDHEVSGAIDKFIQGVAPFAYAPLFIFFGRLYGRKPVRIVRYLPFLALFAFSLVVIGVGSNSRSKILIGAASVVFAYFLGLLLGKFNRDIFTPRNVILGFLCFVLFTGPVSDLATAMAMVRGSREEVSRSKIVALTVEAYSDKQAIHRYRSEIRAGNDWDEYYFDNVLISRFSNVKYIDLSLVSAARIDNPDQAMAAFSANRLLTTLPEPALDLVGVKISKDSFNRLSFGDYLFHLSGADSSVLGGKRVGHMSGTGLAAFGWWYLLLFGLGMVPTFILLDSFYLRNMPGWSRDGASTSVFSLCGLLAIVSIFLFLPKESVVLIYSFLLRGWLQMVLLYFIIFHITRGLTFLKSTARG